MRVSRAERKINPEVAEVKDALVNRFIHALFDDNVSCSMIKLLLFRADRVILQRVKSTLKGIFRCKLNPWSNTP